MKIHILPSTIDENGMASERQHLLTMIVDDRVAVDAGCLALSCTDVQRSGVRDILLTHTHLDHIAGLPLFIDDLFASLEGPIRIHVTKEMQEILERDIFNWAIYPRFSELSNDRGPVVEYKEFIPGSSFNVSHLSVRAVHVNHRVAAVGYFLSHENTTVAVTGDTAETEDFWELCNQTQTLAAVLVECAFPDQLEKLSIDSNHLTPHRLAFELKKLENKNVPVYIINLKPMYREKVIEQIRAANIPRVEIMKVGQTYEF
jgi:ribonuclease BN (tRNA processing enzyme)